MIFFMTDQKNKKTVERPKMAKSPENDLARSKEVQPKVTTRKLTEADLDEIVRVEKETWPDEWQAPRSSFENRLRLFQEGVIGVFVDGELAGVTTSMPSNFNPEKAVNKMYDPDYTWNAITDEGKIEGAMDLDGNAIYVVSVGVSSKHQGLGLGTKLVEAQKEMATRLGKKYLYLGARVPNLQAYIEYKYDITIPTDGEEDLAELIEDLTGQPLQEIADEFVNMRRGDDPDFCDNGVAKAHRIAIRRVGDEEKWMAMERHFYGKASLHPVFTNPDDDKTAIAKVGFANDDQGGTDRAESLNVGLVVYTEIDSKKTA